MVSTKPRISRDDRGSTNGVNFMQTCKEPMKIQMQTNADLIYLLSAYIAAFKTCALQVDAISSFYAEVE